MKKSSIANLKVAAVVAILLITAVVAFGYYYYNDFTANTTGWSLGYRYGRPGITRNPNSDLVIDRSGSAIRFRGRVNLSDDDYLGTFAGRMAFYNSASFVASATNPFGVEFRRTYSRIDPHADGSANPESHRHMAAMSFWLVRDPDGLQDTATEYTTFPNSIVMYELMRMTYNTGSGQPRSTWGVYQASEQQFDLTQATRPDGTSLNIINNTSYGLEWNYDNIWGALSQGAGTVNGTPNNNNSIIVRLTHDGSTVRFYLNPNPDDTGGNPYPNEFLLVGSAGVDWNDNIKFMMGMESKRTDTEFQNADIDSVLVRSVVSSLKAEITPSRIAKGSTNTYQVVVAPTFSASDAGIGELTITKPAGYTAAWTPAAVQVFSYKGTGTNHGTISGLRRMPYTASVPSSIGQAYITASGDTLKIRFYQGVNSLTTAGVINSQTGSSADHKKIVVSFSMAAPDSANASGDSFTVKADCVKYNGQSYPRWGTTGSVQAVASDAHGSIFTGDTLSVSRFGNPDSLATVSPELVYIGANRTIYLYVATTNENAPPISELRIKVPAGYVVNTADPAKFSSLYVIDDNSHVFATNVAGTDYIHVRYAADSGGYGLPSPGGLDRITIQVDSTPTGFSGAQTNTVWTAMSYSSIPGTIGTACRTNDTYPNRSVLIRTLPPDATGVVVSSIVQSGTNYLYNHTGSGTLSYVVNNNGGAGNTIKRLRVLFPSCVSNADAISSTLLGGSVIIPYSSGINGFVVDYKASGKSIANGGSDTISFVVFDNIVPMSGFTNGNFTVEADNENGDGYVSGSEGAGSWGVVWKNPPASANASIAVQNSLSGGATNLISTADTVSTILVSLVNTGGSYNDIKLAAIDLPTQFTNVLSARSLKMQNSGVNISVSGNRVLVKYHENAVGSLKNTESDTITLQVADNVGLTSPSTEAVAISMANTTLESDLQGSGLIPEASKSLSFRIPDADGDGYVVPLQINASTVTNTMQYIISNTGAYDNYLSEVRIYIPDSIASNMIDASSTHLAAHPGNVSVQTAGFSNYIRVLYHGAAPLYGTQNDMVTFKLIDHIEEATNFTVVAAASNARNEWKTLSVKTGRTNFVVIEIPPASASAELSPNVLYTESVATNRLLFLTIKNTGTGGNTITNATITLPPAIRSKVVSISNDRGASQSYSTMSGVLEVHYTGAFILGSGQSTVIYLTLNNDMSIQQTDLAITGTVENGQGPQVIGSLSSGSLLLSFVERATAEIYQTDLTPNQIYSTDSKSDFVYKLYNGTSGGKAVKRVLIDLPYPFVDTGLQVIPAWPGATPVVVTSNITALDGTVINSGGRAKILINYDANDLDAGSADEIALQVQDVLPQGETNVSFSTWVDYGDGYGFRAAAVASGKSLSIQFVFPDASADAAILPSRVNINDDAVLYSLTVTNTGVSGNHIKMLEITLPEVFTNVSGVNSSIAGATFSNQGRIVYVNYAPVTNLRSGRSDVVSFTAVDNVDSLTNVTVGLRVANSTNSSYYRTAGTISPDSLDLEFYRPDYIAAAMIAPLNPVSSSQPNTIYSSITTSTLEFTVVNNGAPGNDIQEVRLYIPSAVFDPTSLSGATSQRVPPGQIVRSGDLVTVYYTNTGNALLANQSDIIRFVINDVISYANASSSWVSASRFSTSGTTYLTNQTVTGKSSSVSLVMPQPASIASLGQGEVYTGSRLFTVALSLSNTGSGSNALKRIYVEVPSVFRGGLSASSLTNSVATNVSYSGGVFTLTYSGLAAGASETVYLQLSNGSVSTTNTAFLLNADNGTYTNTVSEESTDALKLKVVSPPSGYVEASSPKDGVYNRLHTTDFQNEVKIYIRNDGTGLRPVKRALIIAPEGFSLSSAASSRIGGGFVTVNSNVVTLDYAGGGSEIGVSETDTVSIQVTAPFISGSSNVRYRLQLQDIDPAGLNGGFSEGRLYSGKSWDIAYHHPAPLAEFFVDGYGIGTKPAILVAPRNGIASTNIILTVKNIGISSNLVHRVRVIVPDLFSTITAPSSSHGGVCLVSSNVVDVYYSNATPLVPGASDSIEVTLAYSMADATNNLQFRLDADNGSAYGLQAASLKSGWFDTLDIKYPPLSVLAGVANTASVYTIFTNTTLTYRIKNRAQGYRITRFAITNFYAGMFDTVTVNSSKGTSSGTNANGTIVLDFAPGSEIAFNEIETVGIGLKYNVSPSYMTTLTLQGVVTLTNELLGMATNISASVLEAIDTDIGNADNQRVRFGPAPFGTLFGTILPRYKMDTQNPGKLLPNIVTVDIISLTNSTVITTPYKQESGAGGGLINSSLSVYSDPSSGNYSLSYIPDGSYRLRFAAEGFRTLITNVTVISNTIVKVSNLEMKNGLLDSDSSRQQVVVDYNDTNTRFIVESGGLLDQFSLDIRVVDMDEDQEAFVQSGSGVKNLSATDTLGCFRFSLLNNIGELVEEQSLGGDATLVLHYESTDLNLPLSVAPQDWQASDLAIYYWKDSTDEWVPIGGTVDQSAKTVTARVNYLHRYYAVMSVPSGVASKPIYNVKASPNPFTPGRGSAAFSNLKLTFSFNQEVESYTVSIYTMRGRRIRYFKRDGSQGQGAVFWDGRHDNGFKLPGGVYIYQIRANGRVYSGSVLMLQ